MDKSLNYFVCTLGQAAELKAPNGNKFDTVNFLLDAQAKIIPNRPAVAFHRPCQTGDSSEEGTDYDLYTFQQLRNGSVTVAARLLADQLKDDAPQGQTYGLLAQSTPGFLFIWLALMRAGASVLLIAPQCQAVAVAHLCRTCNVKALFSDETCQSLAQTSAKDAEIPAFLIPFVWSSEQDDLFEVPANDMCWPEPKPSDVAYLHHTSGTSSGLPKPIPQSHHAGVGALPALDGAEAATFSITPLYHGGIADCFRSWTSGALIWLFPGTLPITTKNILTCFQSGDAAERDTQLPRIKYFSSVPFVLQMVASDAKGLSRLQKMDIVGVGGAALPEDVGNQLVSQNVNLISRFGSAECGFLMSSHRPYEADRAWHYLRPGTALNRLRFEPREDGLSELVILQDWPHLAKQNREDGSYASADLFEPHPSIPDAWRYHSRADSQLTLLTGKKFDPAPLEDEIAVNPCLSHVLIFGSGKEYPGALLWRSENSSELSVEQILDAVWNDVHRLNQDTQGHARIARSMLLVLPTNTAPPAKSSKGTLLRKSVEETYSDIIEQAYSTLPMAERLVSTTSRSLPDEAILPFLREVFRSVTSRGTDLPLEADFFTQGIDSVACIQVRAILQRRFEDESLQPLPINIVYDSGNMQRLASFLVSYRKGHSVEDEDEHDLMEQLVNKYSSFDDEQVPRFAAPNATDQHSSGRTYVLTGATGSLGAHILDQLLHRTDVTRITCLVRGADERAAFQRVSKSLEYRKLRSINPTDKRVRCVPARLGDRYLGLSQSAYMAIAEQADVIIHAAWSVNFSTRLRSFEHDHIGGLQNLLLLALESGKTRVPRFVLCSSVASVALSKTEMGSVPEEISHRPSEASPLGYSRSKWVAEAICARAVENRLLRSNIDVVRIGQLCGDTKDGIWNLSEAWPLMLSATRSLSAVPDLGPEPLRWLPVDIAARSVLQIADRAEVASPQEPSSIRIFHVLRQGESSEPTWNDLIQWLKSEFGPDPLWVTTLSSWNEKLRELADDHPAKKLLGLWTSRAQGQTGGKYDADTDEVRFEQKQTSLTCPDLNTKGLIDREFFDKMWQWIDSAQ